MRTPWVRSPVAALRAKSRLVCHAVSRSAALTPCGLAGQYESHTAFTMPGLYRVVKVTACVFNYILITARTG